jgi:nucleotide-binding universal stress UspA family protein
MAALESKRRIQERRMYTKLLVPVDGTDFCDRTIRASIELARVLGASITAFVAEPELPMPAVGRPAAVLEMENALHDSRTERHAQTVLTGFAARARHAGVAFTGCFARSDRIDEAIAGAAHQHGCDLIVMATHSRGAFGSLLYKSNTKRVMSRSPVPVLVLH